MTEFCLALLEMINRLKNIRDELKLTQSDMAERLNCSLQMYQYIENGQRRLSSKWIDLISDTLKIEPYEILVDPQYIVNESEKELIAKYRQLAKTSPHEKEIVDKIINNVSA